MGTQTPASAGATQATGFGAAVILDECGPELGLLLWRAYADVMLWAVAGTTRGGREELFSGGELADAAPVGAGVRDALFAIDEMRQAPVAATDSIVAHACGELSSYAAEHGWVATAMLLAEAGAYADPDDVVLVLRVGQLARRAADYTRAEPWLRHALGQARRRGDWACHCTAAEALANLCWQRGNLPKARGWNLRALRIAREHGLRALQAEALHALFVLDVHARNYARADLYCRAAFELMERGTPALFRLAHDIAWAYCERGYYDRAASILEALLPKFRRPDERVLVWASLARAAGCAGRRDLYRRAADAVVDLAAKSVRGGSCADALLAVARGAAGLRLPTEAEAVARMAMTLARVRAEGEVVIRAEELIESLAEEFAPRADPSLHIDVPPDAELAPELVRALA